MTVREGKGLFADTSAIPVVPECRLGSYALDFLTHGKLDHLQNDNMLSATQSWKVIDQWRSFLWTLHKVLGKGGRENKVDTQAIKALYEELKDKLDAEGA
jgi:hypothetical protein